MAGPDALGAPDLLGTARDRSGRSPLDVLATACAGCPGPTLELRTGADGFDGTALVMTLDGGPSRRADPRSLPVGTDSVGVVRAVMCLAEVAELDALFGELRRVLRPTGTLAALLPARPNRWPIRRGGWPDLQRELGEYAEPRHRAMRDHPSWLLTSADFAVLADLRYTFHLPLPAPDAATQALTALTRYGFVSPTTPAAALDAARSALRRQAGPTRTLPVPIRLLAGRR